MNSTVAVNLGLILLLPWYLVLGIVFWRTRKPPYGLARRLTDAAVLLLALAGAGIGGYWSFHHADPGAGAIWKQVLASLVGYGVFLLILACGFLTRRRAG